MLATLTVLIVAILHLTFAWFEIFGWVSWGPTVFGGGKSADWFEETRMLAANQGFYNCFLATGLLWSLVLSDPVWRVRVAFCFLIFVLAAGIGGWLTVSVSILYVQAIPAALGLVFVWFGWRGQLKPEDRLL